MGLFDIVICEYPLPLPEEVKDLKSPPTWNKVEFQTKSMGGGDFGLGGFMDKYTVEDDGQIYKVVVDREYEIDEDGSPFLNEKDNGIEKVEFTGDLVFYHYHEEEEWDYWVEFSALFWKGELKEIKLNEWKREDSSHKRESREKIKKALNKQAALKNSKAYKIKEFIKKPIRCIVYIIKFLLGLIVRFVWWVESKLL